MDIICYARKQVDAQNTVGREIAVSNMIGSQIIETK
jgi:hypothetical protein